MRLSKVYQEFDLNGDGTVGSTEMLALGRARRKLGHKSSEWTNAQNIRLLQEMGSDGEHVTEAQFVSYFSSHLSHSDGEFEKILIQFSRSLVGHVHAFICMSLMQLIMSL